MILVLQTISQLNNFVTSIQADKELAPAASRLKSLITSKTLERNSYFNVTHLIDILPSVPEVGLLDVSFFLSLCINTCLGHQYSQIWYLFGYG